MKKILLSIFGGLLLTSSISLITGQNVNVVIKQKEQEEVKKQELLNSWVSVNKQSNLNEVQINAFKTVSQSWDTETIDDILNQALWYDNNQLLIDKDRLNTIKLPKEILQNINLALDNLNNAVALGYIKVNIISNNKVQLIYPNNDNANSEIVIFDNQDVSSSTYNTVYGSYMWYSAYGPSRWWKFWEWGGYIHFNEQAVKNAWYLNIAASVISIYFLLKNLKQLSNIIDELSYAINLGNTNKINKVMKDLAILLGAVNLDFLGKAVDVLAIFTAIIAFAIAIQSASFIGAIFELFISIIVSVTSQMLGADRGKGVKWQWYNFVIPGVIWAE